MGYDHFAGLVTKENIEQEIEENFSGYLLTGNTLEKTLTYLKKLKKEEMIKIVEENYAIIHEKLNIDNNCYIIPTQMKKTSNYYQKFFELLNELEKTQESIQIQKKEIHIERSEKEELKEQLKQKDEKIQYLEKEIFEIYESKRWRYVDKILKIFH